MDYTIEVIEREAMPALTIRKTVSADHLRHEIGSAYAAIASYLKELGVNDSGRPFVAYFNMDMQHLEVEMGFVLSVDIPGYGDIIGEKIPAGNWVSFIHKGSYKEMGHGYAAATRWMKEHAIQPTGIVYEHYLNDPTVVPESELLTRVEFAI